MPFDSAARGGAPLAGIAVMLASVLLYSLNDVLGKWLVASFAVGQVMLLRGVGALAALQMLGGFALGAVMLPGQGWVTPSLLDLFLMLLLGLVSTFGHMSVTRALKLAPASVVVPYQHSFILWAELFGWLFFGEVPGWPIYAGAAVVVAAGIWLFRLEARAIVVEGPA